MENLALARASTSKKSKTSRSGSRAVGARKTAKGRKKSVSKKKSTKVIKKKTAKTAKSKATRKKTSKAGARKAAPKKKAAVKKKAAKKATVKKKAAPAARKASGKKTTSRKKTAKTAGARAGGSASAKVAATTKRSGKAAAKKPGVAAKSTKAGSSRKSAVPAGPPPPTVEEALAKLKYKEGDHVVHPKYGLGKIRRIVDRRLTARTVPCLVIHFSHQDMRLTIPVDQVERSGLRRPIGRKEVDDVLKVLRGRATFDAKRRSAKRVADYQKRVRQGDPTSLAEVVRDLSRLSLRKVLSYEERKILSEALRVLSREVALARGHDPDDVIDEIEAIVNR